MSNNINIADILRDCPRGMKLYSPYYGEIRLDAINTAKNFSICIKNNADGIDFTLSDGKFCKSGECCIFPSAQMRDWSKFFHRGDVVYNPSSQMYAIFDGWADDTYTEFNTTLNLYPNHEIGEEEVCKTECFDIVKAGTREHSSVMQDFEKLFNGKYNPDTLCMIPFFKDGDIVDITTLDGLTTTAIVKSMNNTSVALYVDFCKQTGALDYNEVLSYKHLSLVIATSEHIKELYDALERNGKYWDSEHRQIKIMTFVPSCPFKPFDKVLGRDSDEENWRIDLFERYAPETEKRYICQVKSFHQCIPYNEKTSHLIGTTDPYNEE